MDDTVRAIDQAVTEYCAAKGVAGSVGWVLLAGTVSIDHDQVHSDVVVIEQDERTPFGQALIEAAARKQAAHI